MTSLSCNAAISAVSSQPSRTLFPSYSASHFSRLFPSRSPFNVGVKCSYGGSSSIKDATAGTIDVVADIKTEKIVVLGGNGFVGSAVCRAAISKGIEVISVSRSGRPSYSGSWIDLVSWVTGSDFLNLCENKQVCIFGTEGLNLRIIQALKKCISGVTGDVFYLNWDEVLAGATAVVSTLGGFGSEEQMQRINGEANILAVNAAKKFGIPKFILISVHDYNLPSFLLTSGYFTGKRKAESEVLSKYPSSGVVFRPGLIYGKRMVDGFEIPLNLIGEPLDKFLSAVGNFTKPLNSLPASDLLLAPPVSVDDLAFAVVNAIRDDYFFGVFTIEQIKEAAAAAKV